MEKNLILYLLVFIRPKDVRAIYGVSRQTVWRYVREGKLEPPRQVSPGVAGWDRSVLDAFFGIK
jgi:predicted DNA-binding transcriptional regulator AlpA